MKVEKATVNDADELTGLTIRSKSYWDYSAEQIEEWRDLLTIKPAYIEKNHVYKFIEGAELVGYYSYYHMDDDKVKLDNLFLDPPYIGKGYGKSLMDEFIKRVSSEGARAIVLDSEPFAERFYQKLGFKVIGQLASSVKDRFLPIMELEL